jgi:hypothetical protein
LHLRCRPTRARRSNCGCRRTYAAWSTRAASSRSGERRAGVTRFSSPGRQWDVAKHHDGTQQGCPRSRIDGAGD